MSIKKTTGAEVYSVSENGEWATIVLRAWEAPADSSGRRFCGELLVNSTFGAWSHYWGACGEPFKQFLVGLDFGYLFGKFMGRSLVQFDGQATVNDLRQRLLQMRRKRWIDMEPARWLFDEIEDRRESMERSVESFCEVCASMRVDADSALVSRHVRAAGRELAELLEEPWNQTKTRISPEAEGFWRNLWVPFVKELRAELQAGQQEAPEAQVAQQPRASAEAAPVQISADIRLAWLAAMTLANNLCVQISDRHLADDENAEAAVASDCANSIRAWIDPGDALGDMLAEAQGGLPDDAEPSAVAAPRVTG